MNTHFKTGPAFWVLSAALGAAPLQAMAQTAASSPPAAQAAQPETLQEVIVTAQKRSQSISNVGMAITAVSGAQLQQLRVTDVSDLSKLDPSFVASQSFYGTPVYTIRGVGYNDYSLAASPTVSVYSDEVPYPYLALTKAVSFDLERVEVLKGPQGTLFGQNATGGAVNYIDAKPTHEFAAGLAGSYTSWNAANINGFVSGPITSTLTGRLAFDVNEGGAWQKSESRPNDHLGDRDQKRLRSIVEWRPSDRLKVDLKVVGWTDNSDTLAPQQIGLVPGNPGVYPNSPAANPASYAGRTYTSIVGETVLPTPTKDTQAEWASGVNPKMDEHAYQFAGRAEYKVAENILLTLLGSYQQYDQRDLYYNTGTATVQSTLTSGRVASGYTELRLSGQAFDKRLEWLIGADYSDTTSHEQQLTHLGTTAEFGLIQLPFLFGQSTHFSAPFQYVRNYAIGENSSEAVFGNVEYHLLPNLSVHGGIRYTSTDIKNSEASYDVDGLLGPGLTDIEIVRKLPYSPIGQGGITTFGPNGIPGVQNDKLDENNVSWRLGGDWKPFARTLIYATVSKGYKSGSFPVLPASVYVQLLPVKQESVLAYELGLKSRFFDNRIEVDGAVFYYDYRDKQVYSSVPDPLGIFGVLNALVNVPKSDEKGAELAVKYHPIRGLTLSASTTYIDSRVDDDFSGYNPYSLTTQINLKGEAFPNTPKWAARLGGQYDWDVLGGRYGAYVGFDASYVGSSQGQFGNASAVAQGFPSLEIKSYATLDLRAGLDSRDGHWRFQVFGQNVTNTYYWTQATHVFDTAVRFAGAPATFGASIAYRY